jgi:predicted nucleic-acid-binding protein
MTIHVIDTNIVLRLLMADQPAHFEHAKRVMDEVRAGKCKAYLPESVLAECILVLTKFYKVPKEEAARKLRELLDYKGFTGDHLAVLKDALAIFIAEKLAFVDALVLALARHRGWHVETFDKRLAKLAARGAP